MVAKVTLLLLRLLVGGIFIYAGALKAVETQDFARDIQHYSIIPWSDLILLLAVYLPWVEIFAGLAVVFRCVYLGGLVAIAGMMLIFTGALTSAWARGLDISCGCFGKEKEFIRTNFPAMLARDLAILSGSAILLGCEWRRRTRAPDFDNELARGKKG
ncbi:MAG: MauE/DoxX family redox-associated membrane protein [Chthoniobacteraceae bacterium]